MSAFIPEVSIYKVVESMLKYLSTDFAQSTDEKKSVLWYMFGEDSITKERLKLGNFDYFEQAKHLLLRNSGDPRMMELAIGYNMERMHMPTMHIMLPSEQPKGAAIGDNEGYEAPIMDTSERTSRAVLSADSSVVYNLLLTSDNSAEVLLMYHFLKVMELTWHEQFELRGFQNLTWGGADIQFNDEMIPANIFHRNFTMGFDYEYEAPALTKTPYGKNFIINSGIINPESDAN